MSGEDEVIGTITSLASSNWTSNCSHIPLKMLTHKGLEHLVGRGLAHNLGARFLSNMALFSGKREKRVRFQLACQLACRLKRE